MSNLSNLSGRKQTIRAAQRHGIEDAAQVANNPTYDRPNSDYDFGGDFTSVTSGELRVPGRWRDLFEVVYSRTVGREVERLERE